MVSFWCWDRELASRCARLACVSGRLVADSCFTFPREQKVVSVGRWCTRGSLNDVGTIGDERLILAPPGFSFVAVCARWQVKLTKMNLRSLDVCVYGGWVEWTGEG